MYNYPSFVVFPYFHHPFISFGRGAFAPDHLQEALLPLLGLLRKRINAVLLAVDGVLRVGGLVVWARLGKVLVLLSLSLGGRLLLQLFNAVIGALSVDGILGCGGRLLLAGRDEAGGRRREGRGTGTRRGLVGSGRVRPTSALKDREPPAVKRLTTTKGRALRSEERATNANAMIGIKGVVEEKGENCSLIRVVITLLYLPYIST